MTEFNVRVFRDAWVNPNRTGLNTGSSGRLVLDNTGRRVFVRPALPSGVFGRTVLSATLRAHVRGSWAAQTVTLTRVTQRWVEGRVTSANQPTVTTTGQVAVATGALSDGDAVEWDVTALMQLFADGTDYYGFRITTDAATRQMLYGYESSQPSWELEIVVSDAPDVPSNLRPDGGAVTNQLPVVAWDFVDLGGDSTEQAQYRIQLDVPASGAEPDGVTPDYDSGWVYGVDPQADLAALAANRISNPYFSVDASGWQAGFNTTIARSTAHFTSSPASLELTAVAAGHMYAWTTTRHPVKVGESTYAEFYVKSPTVARTASVAFRWFDAAGVQISITDGAAVATTTGGFTLVSASTGMPAGAVSVEYGVHIQGAPAAGEKHYVDDVWANQGASRLRPSVVSTNYWRVVVRDGDNMTSPWSDWADFTVAAKPSLVIDSPTGVFGDPTPTITAHLDTGTISAWSIVVTGPDRSDVRARSGKQTGAVSWTVPLRDEDGRRVIREGQQGWARVRMWDSVNRVPAVGDPAYVETWVALNLDEDLALAAPTGLSVVQVTDGDPRHTWTWSRTEDADAWLIQIDGDTVVRLDPEDVTVDAGVYTWVDAGIIPPWRSVSAGVRAVEAGSKATTAATVTVDSGVKGVWIVPVDGLDDPVQLAGGDVASWAETDAYATYETVGGLQVDVFYGRRPRAGVFEGVVDSRNDVEATRAALEAYSRNRTREFRLIWPASSLLVRLRDVDMTPSNAILRNNLEHVVRFGFVKRGD